MTDDQRGTGLVEPPAGETGIEEGARERDGARAAAAVPVGSAAPASHRGVVREYFESLVVTAIMALFGMTFIVQAVKVPTGSMQNTILIGDHLLVNKFIFGPGPVLPFLPMREIERGDIVVFKYPGKFQGEARFRDNPQVDDEDPNNIPFKTNYVKRVVGLPGERVEIRGTRIFINGQPLDEKIVAARNPPLSDDLATSGVESSAPLKDESGAALVGENAPDRGSSPYTVYWDPETLRAEERLSGDVAADLELRALSAGETVFEVPEGHYLVLGDNRENSQDSRFWGYVPREMIVGRAMFVYWSYDESLPSTGNFLEDFLKNTRWGRTGTLVK